MALRLFSSSSYGKAYAIVFAHTSFVSSLRSE